MPSSAFLQGLASVLAGYQSNIPPQATFNMDMQIHFSFIPPDASHLKGYLPAGTGLGCGFLPFDSFFLSLLPMMLSPYCQLPQKDHLATTVDEACKVKQNLTGTHDLSQRIRFYRAGS